MHDDKLSTRQTACTNTFIFLLYLTMSNGANNTDARQSTNFTAGRDIHIHVPGVQSVSALLTSPVTRLTFKLR
jgi:hypothetical protein